MAEELIKKIGLTNGLTLELYDASRRVAGDRWLVSLVAKIAIPNNSPFLDKADASCNDMEAFQKAFGEKILFEKKRARNFIEERKKEETLEGLMTSFLSASLFYLSNDEFPRNFVLSELKKFQETAPWRKQ
jgi:hypothetical protein